MNKKTKFLKTVCLFALLLAGAFTASAYVFKVDGIYYDFSYDNNGEIVGLSVTNNGYDSYSGDIVIPETVYKDNIVLPVIDIRYGAFRNCSTMVSIAIPKTVKSIGEYAFAGCSGLTRVDITDLAAWCGISLASTYDGGVYYACNPLHITHRLFLNGSEVLNMTIPDGVQEIKPGVFSGLTRLKSVTLSNTVKSIGDYAFDRCNVMKSVSFGNSVTSIGVYAFGDCGGLTSLEIPNSVTTIGELAFANCSGLTSVSIGNSVRYIGQSAFADCHNLARVDITDLEAWCNITFDYLANYAFASNPLANGAHLYLNGDEVCELKIPTSIKEVKDYAFIGCRGLTSVEFPNSVMSIGDYAFGYCADILYVDIPSSVKSLGDRVFQNCEGMKKLCWNIKNFVLNNNWGIDMRSPFYSCKNLRHIIVGNDVEYIDDYTFYLAQNNNIDTVTCLAKDPPVITSDLFYVDTYSRTVLQVPDESILTYRTAEGWRDFLTIVGKNMNMGDVNLDGEVNIADVNAVIDNILTGLPNSLSDVNGDGEVNIADINALIDMILR